MRIAVLVGILVVLSVFAVSQEPTPAQSGQQSTGAKRDAVNRGDSSTDQDKRIDRAGKAQPRRDEPESKSPTFLEILNVSFNGILAVTAILGALAISRQLSMMKRQMADAEQAAKDARDETERALGVAERQAAALTELSDGTVRSVAVAEQQLNTVLDVSRAILSVSSTERIPDIRFPPRVVHVAVANSGHTPALTVRAMYGSSLHEGTDVPPNVARYLAMDVSQTKGSYGFVAPRKELVFRVELPTLGIFDVGRILDGEATLWLFGKLDYVDIFGRRACVPFLYRFAPDVGQWFTGPDHNQPEHK